MMEAWCTEMGLNSLLTAGEVDSFEFLFTKFLDEYTSF